MIYSNDEIYVEPQNRFEEFDFLFDVWLDCTGLIDNYESFWINEQGYLLLEKDTFKISADVYVTHNNKEYVFKIKEGCLDSIINPEDYG